MQATCTTCNMPFCLRNSQEELAAKACESGHWEPSLALLSRCLEQSWTPHGLHVGSLVKAMPPGHDWEVLHDFLATQCLGIERFLSLGWAGSGWPLEV